MRRRGWQAFLGMIALSCAACGENAPDALNDTPRCGDGVVQQGESCDSGGQLTAQCAYGQTSCIVCDARCQFVAGQLAGFCGDRIVQPNEGEECDAGRMPSPDCAPGAASCMVCDANCKRVPGRPVGRCGDGQVQPMLGEQCDHGGQPGGTCAYGQMSCMVCDAQCQEVAGQVTGFCGDGVVDAANQERCDPGAALSCALDGLGGEGRAVCAAGCAAVDAGGCYNFTELALTDVGGCAADARGRVVCWGQLEAPAEPLRALTAGTSFVCGVTLADEQLRCWGPRVPAVPLTSVSAQPVRAIAAGDGFVCTLRGEAGGAQLSFECFGEAPVRPVGVERSTLRALAASDRHICALRADMTPLCWGSGNMSLGLGDAPTVRMLKVATSARLACGITDEAAPRLRCWGDSALRPPLALTQQESFVDVMLGDTHGCALRADGTARCWGATDDGAELVSSQLEWRALSLADGASCGVLRQGSVVCWGQNVQGQTAPPMAPARRVWAAQGLSCAASVDGAAKCWGTNRDGRAFWAPARLQEMALSARHTCALSADGQVSCTGANDQGQRELPAQQGFKAVAAGDGFTCALTQAEGQARCVGATAIARTTPQVAGLALLAAATDFACAADAQGALTCWGQAAPTPPSDLRATALTGGNSYVCALDAEGAVRCFGETKFRVDEDARLARIRAYDDTLCGLDMRGAPRCWGALASLALGAGPYEDIAVGAQHVCAVDTTGVITCWAAGGSQGAAQPPAPLP